MAEGKNTTDRGPVLSTTLWVAALSVLAGFAAVYVTHGRNDNAGVNLQAGSEAKPVLVAPATHNAGDAAKLGAMAGFVRKATTEPLTDISFIGADGKELKLSAFKGRTVLLNLWATWCAPCRKEMPSLDRLQKDLGSDKFEVVALAVDRAGLEGAGKFLEETKVASLKLYADPTAKSGTALRALGMPTTILIDKDGREIGRLAGPAEWDGAEAKKLVEAALN